MKDESPLTISDVFELPRPEDIRAMRFVIRLREAAPDSEEVRLLVQDYVVTPAIERELPRLLDDMKQVFERGEEYGRFIHGSFGSGKSHFMTLLGLLLEGVEPAWEKFGSVLAAHRRAQAEAQREATDHRAWIPGARLLVVRLHMLSVRGRATGLDRAVYDAFNEALKRRGKAPFEFLDVEGIFEEVRREAESYGDIVWKHLENAGIVGSRVEFDAVAAGSPEDRERFVRAWLVYKGRDAAQAGIDPRWSQGLRNMCEHARSQGFGGIVVLIDELLLWLGEKSGTEFVREINDLNTFVDHSTGQRPLPVFVFAAVQRDLREWFPDLVDEGKIHEHLDHHSERFKPYIKLQDVELRHIVRGRVLRPRNVAAIDAAVARLTKGDDKLVPELFADGDHGYLRDVYPFHPALIEMLVDVSSLMQRERSALRLLYELLVFHHPRLPLGQFLPVGSAFSAIFPTSGVEASKKVDVMQDIHQQYYDRLVPAMQEMVQDPATDFQEERRRALDQLVKTVLLAEVSPRLKKGGLTVERLVQLNSVDVEGETLRGRVRVALTDLLALSQRVPDLQVAGPDKTAIVRYVLGRVSLGEILSRARIRVDNGAQRYKVFWGALKAALGLEGLKGFEEGGPNEGEWELNWRRTRRRGHIKLGNVREMSYDDFDQAVPFNVLIDYPWDDPGHTVDEDRLRATNVRKNRGVLYTVCWLPRHMTPQELGVLTELAAVRHLLSEAGQEELLETYGLQDRNKILEQAGVRESQLRGQLAELVREVYLRHGELTALISDIDPHPQEGITPAENLERITTLLLDRRYPQHPHFGAEPKKADLEALLGWMVKAGELNQSVAFDENESRALRQLGQPLELVNLGQTKAQLRLDSRYVKDVLQRAEQDSVAWTTIADHLRDTYGFTPLVVDLFLCFLCQRDHRALGELDSDPVEVRIGMPSAVRIRLQRGTVLSLPEWHRLRDLGHQLFEVPRDSATRSLQVQDRTARILREKAKAKRDVLQQLHQRLAVLNGTDGARGAELAAANTRLAPLVGSGADSHRALSSLLTAWPEAEEDSLVGLVRGAEAILVALDLLNEQARDHLQSGRTHPRYGTEVQDHLAALDVRLKSAQAEKPLTLEWVKEWNEVARDLIRKLVEQPPAPVTVPVTVPVAVPVVTPVTPVTPSDRKSKELCARELDPSDPDAVSSFLAEVRSRLQELGDSRIRVALVQQEDEP